MAAEAVSGSALTDAEGVDKWLQVDGRDESASPELLT